MLLDKVPFFTSSSIKEYSHMKKSKGEKTKQSKRNKHISRQATRVTQQSQSVDILCKYF